MQGAVLNSQHDSHVHLHIAPTLGDIALMNQILKASSHTSPINDRDLRGQIPLHFAKSSEIVKTLINAGIDVNLQDNKGFTPLHLAVQKGKGDVITALIEEGATANIKTKEG